MQEIISRKEAIARGLNKYFTGKPCINGHVSERYVRGYQCIKCYQEIKKDYYESTKEVRNAYHVVWVMKNREHVNAYAREYRHENREHVNAYARKYYLKNRDKILAYQRKRRLATINQDNSSA